ncbi:ribbon-helix-helix protein, CopG family [Georgenia sp. TF02-10]|uniref:ribbon-helix-helix protein, CopG family n=1 Tax=Georgenia sp. TF02-10 TaxID=2917725 RepID=UPI001FA784FA|nr:ribbon-helix-helix protein, CopG family [Georgenia sp. TF02-10]UNX55621.1 ribbon-helix-helix protein, CopG family [Georgenia sp. TF02-10]
MRSEKDYEALAAWAESDEALQLGPDTKIDRGSTEGRARVRAMLEEAAGGRAGLERALGGRPPLDPSARPGEHSPARKVRLPKDMNDALAARARAEGRRVSDVIRAALAEYLSNQKAS